MAAAAAHHLRLLLLDLPLLVERVRRELLETDERAVDLLVRILEHPLGLRFGGRPLRRRPRHRRAQQRAERELEVGALRVEQLALELDLAAHLRREMRGVRVGHGVRGHVTMFLYTWMSSSASPLKGVRPRSIS